MPARVDKAPRKKVGISLRIDQADALVQLADAERHGNVSLIVQRAIDREIERIARETAKEQAA